MPDISHCTQRRVLVAVTGMSPQVVTETLWALLMRGELPEDVYVITTVHGRNRIIRDLLDPADGHFHAFCRDFNLKDRIRFPQENITVISTPAGEPLADIRTPEDNSYAADVILRTIRTLCEDPDSQVHVSIAGGRKSMGFFAGYALSLFGRPQDRLSHVLVSEPFESNKDFFYPSPEERIILAANGSPLDQRTARVMLADIPFVRLRVGLSTDTPHADARFEETVQRVQTELLPLITLRFELNSHAVVCSGRRVDLPPLAFIVFLWFAKRRRQGLPAVRPGLTQATEILTLHADVFPQREGDRARSQKTMKSEEDVLPFIQEKRSLIHRALKRDLPEHVAQHFHIQAVGKRLSTAYSLLIDPQAVEIVP